MFVSQCHERQWEWHYFEFPVKSALLKVGPNRFEVCNDEVLRFGIG